MTATTPSDIPPKLSALASEAVEHFEGNFSRKPRWAVAAPGRVNLIGEHVDYNDGFVLPMAFERWVVMAADKTDSPMARFFSTLTGEVAEVALDEVIGRGAPPWSNYVRGVFAGFASLGADFSGLDVVVHSNVPKGGGLSSSAALEVATATLLEVVTGQKLDPIEKALLCQHAEHEFAGVPCGIMDQFASILSREDELLLLDCRSQEIEYVPFNDPDVSILIAGTNVSHELTDGGYARRKEQCEAAAESLLVASLRDVTIDQLTRAQSRMNETDFRRARHVVTEIERTQKAVDAMRRKDCHEVGRLMYASHFSLRDDYEVSCRELDLFVEIAQSLGEEKGVYGCRMTGAGFGGCTVSLVKKESLETIKEVYRKSYLYATGIEPTVFSTRPAAGARVLSGGADG